MVVIVVQLGPSHAHSSFPWASAGVPASPSAARPGGAVTAVTGVARTALAPWTSAKRALTGRAADLAPRRPSPAPLSPLRRATARSRRVGRICQGAATDWPDTKEQKSWSSVDRGQNPIDPRSVFVSEGLDGMLMPRDLGV